MIDCVLCILATDTGIVLDMILLHRLSGQLFNMEYASYDHLQCFVSDF